MIPTKKTMIFFASCCFSGCIVAELFIIQNWYVKIEAKKTTLPETNMAPENDPLEKEIPIGNHHF